MGGVASEKIATFVALLTFFSASLPKKPIRAILLRYKRFSCSAHLSRAPGSEWARLPRPEAAFLGGPERRRGSQNRNGAVGKVEASQTPGAPQKPRSSALRQTTDNATQTDRHFVVRSRRRNAMIQTITESRARPGI